MRAAGAVLAHQGGWDEIVFVMAPIGIFAGLLWLANRRAGALEARPAAEGAATEDPADPDGA